jgi:FkbM family methyltransferase
MNLFTKIRNRLSGANAKQLKLCGDLFLKKRDLMTLKMFYKCIQEFIAGHANANFDPIRIMYDSINKKKYDGYVQLGKYKFSCSKGIASMVMLECVETLVHYLDSHYWDEISWNFTEGPYETNKVRLCDGDVVIDAGANMGFFAIPTSVDYPNCKVYAFEPQPSAYKILEQNIKVNELNNVSVVKLALGNTNEVLEFFEEQGWNAGSGLITTKPIADREGYTYMVKCVSIDEWVKDNNIPRIDFIKADIEGAERLMLAGARETLHKFRPRLAICTYHLPDDPQVLSKLILDANPEYHIEQKAKKLYAY